MPGNPRKATAQRLAEVYLLVNFTDFDNTAMPRSSNVFCIMLALYVQFVTANSISESSIPTASWIGSILP